MTEEVRLALDAMGTRFELVMYGRNPVHLRAAGEEALAEIERLHRQLSRFDRASDVSWINAHASDAPVFVEARLFDLLDRCRRLSIATGGAFDVTVGALMEAWATQRQRAMVQGGGGGGGLDATTWEVARQAVGVEHLRLDPMRRTVAFARRGMAIDLGAAGKGYAIDAAIDVLRTHGVSHALLHGGTSSVHGLGRSPDGAGWPIAWEAPAASRRRLMLNDGALSVSAGHGKSFSVDGKSFGHVMDPRAGHPATARAAMVTGPRSFECDALSTALLVHGASWLGTLRVEFPGYDGAVA